MEGGLQLERRDHFQVHARKALFLPPFLSALYREQYRIILLIMPLIVFIQSSRVRRHAQHIQRICFSDFIRWLESFAVFSV